MIGNRIRVEREARDLTIEAVADAIEISVSQLSRIETGKREARFPEVERIAKFFQMSVERLTSEPGRIPVVGRVSAGGSIESEWENQSEPLFEIELPFPLGEDAIGFQITGESMWPKYDPDDVIVVSRHGEALDSLLGFEAVVRTGGRDEGGSRYFKRIIRAGTPGLFDLESYNAPPIRNQTIGWAAGLIARVPASRWRKLNGKSIKTAVKRAKKA